MDQLPFDAAGLERARRQGRWSGSDPIEQAGSCPYIHDQIHLRRAWLAGFSEGRARPTLRAAASDPSPPGV